MSVELRLKEAAKQGLQEWTKSL